jgi:hypothetical protein
MCARDRHSSFGPAIVPSTPDAARVPTDGSSRCTRPGATVGDIRDNNLLEIYGVRGHPGSVLKITDAVLGEAKEW